MTPRRLTVCAAVFGIDGHHRLGAMVLRCRRAVHVVLQSVLSLLGLVAFGGFALRDVRRTRSRADR